MSVSQGDPRTPKTIAVPSLAPPAGVTQPGPHCSKAGARGRCRQVLAGPLPAGGGTGQVTDGKLLQRCGKTTACGRASQGYELPAGLPAEERHGHHPSGRSASALLSISHFLLGLTYSHIEGYACLSPGEHSALFSTSVPRCAMTERGGNYLLLQRVPLQALLSCFHRPHCH